MKVELRLVPERTEPALIVEAPALTPAVEELLSRLEGMGDGTLPGFRGEKAYLLKTADIVRFYGESKAVFAEDGAGERYEVKLRLYELEEQLDPHAFVRISNSEIVNLKQVTALDLTLGGTIKMTLAGGTVCWVSRRNVKNIKRALGL